MSLAILTTKLYVPPLRPGSISRPRLLARLNEGLGPEPAPPQDHFPRKLTLISAPAGFGKTTLVAEWLERLDRPRSQDRVAWLSLDEGDNDPVRFLMYLAAALQRVDGQIGLAMQRLLGSPQFAAEPALTLLINDVAATPDPFLLVLDDYHAIHLQAVHRAVEFLVSHQPSQMHLVLTTRQDPPLPLPRLRARDQVTEIREDDLRFTVAEASAFLRQALGPALDPEEIAVLQARTEGWIAGLQLATLALQGILTRQEGPDRRAAEFVESFSGSHRHIIDYLAGEVLAWQSDDLRDFMRQTATLERLTAPLCNELTGRQDAATVFNFQTGVTMTLPLDGGRAAVGVHLLYHRRPVCGHGRHLWPAGRLSLYLKMPSAFLSAPVARRLSLR